jgi:PAS domain S-box-containing protein
MIEKFIEENLEEIRNQIVDTILTIASFLGTFAYILSVSRIPLIGFNVSYIIEGIIIVSLLLITFFRKSINGKVKTYIVIFLVYIVSISSAYTYGLFSSSRVYIILIPFFAILLLPFRQTLFILCFVILSFLVIGYFHSTGILTVPPKYIPDKYILQFFPWVMTTLHILIIAIVVLIVIRKFIIAYTNQIKDLEISNQIITEKERNYREIFNSTADAIFVHDINGDILDVNDAMLKMYNLTKEEIPSLKIKDLSENGPEFNAEKSSSFFQDLKLDNELKFEWKAKKKNGELFWVEVALKKVILGGKERVIAIVRDIDEKKKTAIELEEYKNQLEFLVKERTEELDTTIEELHTTNDELYQQKEELETALNTLNNATNKLVQSEKMASLGVLSAGIAHEINNPLNFINSGYVGLDNYLKKHPDENQENIKPFLNAINEGVKRASNIVTSLNHYCSRDNMPKAACNMHFVIDNCLTMLQNQLKNKVEIKKNYTEIPFKVLGNEGKLHQAILNIISNAEQSIENNGTIEIHTEVKNNYVLINITDSGTGISPENLPKIFDPFFTTKNPGKGTGLGLSITYKIVEEHEGTLTYESQLGKGTKAIIKLPVIKLNEQ